MTGPPFLDSAAVHRLLPMHAAIDAIEAALRAGLDPEADPPRSIVDVRAGQILAMPSASTTYAGIKVVTVAPGNAERDLPRVQGVYVLFDGETLAPLALLDGIALTSLRTPAVSAVAVKHLAPGDAGRLVGHGATVVAVGSHEPDAREVDASLVQRATVVVEARSVARREAGDIVQAPGVPLATLDELVRGTVAVPPDRPRLFKSTGMV